MVTINQTVRGKTFLGTVVAMILLTSSLTTTADTISLFGLTTTTNGISTFVKIDANTGAASPLFALSVPSGFVTGGLAFHAPSGNFLTVLIDPNLANPSKLGLINPVSQALTAIPISGPPKLVEGVEYQSSTDQILITFGAIGGVLSQGIAEIDLTGTVLNSLVNMGLGDRDTLAVNQANGDLFAIDFNGTPPRLAIVDDPFGALTITPFSNPPLDGNLADVAISPSGDIFTARGFGATPELVRVVGNSYQTVGPFNLSKDVFGLAFTPLEPDHFLCYQAKTAEEEPEFERRDVDLEDQFGATTKTVKKPKFLCTPVVKDGEGVVDLQDSEGHLVCYEVKRPEGQDKSEKWNVLVFNQFEDEEEGRILTIKKPRILCVPSEKVKVFEVEDEEDDDEDDDDDDDDDDD